MRVAGGYLYGKEKGTHLNEYKVGLVTPDQVFTLLNSEQPFPPSDDEAEDEHEQRKRATKAEPNAEEPYQNPNGERDRASTKMSGTTQAEGEKASGLTVPTTQTPPTAPAESPTAAPAASPTEAPTEPPG